MDIFFFFFLAFQNFPTENTALVVLCGVCQVPFHESRSFFLKHALLMAFEMGNTPWAGLIRKEGTCITDPKAFSRGEECLLCRTYRRRWSARTTPYHDPHKSDGANVR